jgi:hypothetical protein
MQSGMQDYSASGATAVADQDDWFGEGNAFESGEDLAAALLAMAEHLGEAVPAPAIDAPAAEAARDTFLLIDADSLLMPAESHAGTRQEVVPATAPRSWSVRTPGAVPLPPRAPGRSGWTIRNSVQVLQRTEEIIDALRHEAVVTALGAAARALHPERSVDLRSPQAG